MSECRRARDAAKIPRLLAITAPHSPHHPERRQLCTASRPGSPPTLADSGMNDYRQELVPFPNPRLDREWPQPKAAFRHNHQHANAETETNNPRDESPKQGDHHLMNRRSAPHRGATPLMRCLFPIGEQIIFLQGDRVRILSFGNVSARPVKPYFRSGF